MVEPRGPRLYSIPAHRAFADALAAGLIRRFGSDPLGLARGVVLLPNNRAKLALTIQSEQPNVLGVVLHENTWRQYRGKKRTYVAEMKLKGGKAETVSLALTDFKNVTDGEPLKNWEQLDELGLVAKATLRGPKPIELAADPWQGPRPMFKRLEWVLPVKD